MSCGYPYTGVALDKGWLTYIDCGETLTPSSNTQWPPAGCPNPALPVNTSPWPKANALSFPLTLDTGFGPLMAPCQVYAILSLVWVAENSDGNYDGVIPWFQAYPYIQNIGDGRGYTTNIVGFCSGTGDLADMLKNLQKLEPCNPLVKYLPDIQKLSNSGSQKLTGLAGFAEQVVQQGGGPTGNGAINPNYMKATWQTIAAITSSEGSNYWGQAMELSRKYQLSLPISKGQLFDISLNAGTKAAIKLASQVKAPSPARGGDETTWLLALQSLWLKYIQDHPSIDDKQPDRGLMWQHLVNPKATGKNNNGQVGANNKQANLQLTLPISVNCYGHIINIAAP
ncbi:hypothetical protein HDU98_006863 [Podochytrium sp. JEL0797]|nr:hypothetical protein HDU98_006863 [Podochytrium sp. JEL0797]